MDAHDASSGPDADPLALDEETVERLLAGDVPPGEVPAGYAEVAELLTAVVAAPSQEELAGKAKALAELEAVTRARQAGLAPGGPAGRQGVAGSGSPWWSSWARWSPVGRPRRQQASSQDLCGMPLGASWGRPERSRSRHFRLAARPPR
jgi:hypothetical protein